MKKFKYILTICLFLFLVVSGCSCNNEEEIDSSTALNILNEAKVDEDVLIVTTTKTIVDNKEATSIQTDTYYQDSYYHTSEGDELSTKTWYGYIEDVLYAFYYTKNANNEEVKTSSRIDVSALESVQKQPNSVINLLFNEDNSLIDNYSIQGTKMDDVYTITITNTREDTTNDNYVISIKDNRITKIIKNSKMGTDSIETTYDYTYDIENIQLPTLEEYPLIVNN